MVRGGIGLLLFQVGKLLAFKVHKLKLTVCFLGVSPFPLFHVRPLLPIDRVLNLGCGRRDLLEWILARLAELELREVG